MRSNCLSVALIVLATAAFADVAPEEIGALARTPDAWSPHRVWVGDLLLRRAALFDADSATMLGSLYGGEDLAPVLPLTNAARRAVYLASTY